MSVDHTSAAVYRLNGDYFVHSMSRTTAGFWIASLPGTLLPAASSVEALGSAVGEALNASATDVQTPQADEYRAASAPLLKIAKARSWLTLQRSATLCNVRRTGAEFVAEPTRYGGAAGTERGYHPLSEQSVIVRGSHGPKEIGEAVIAALERCR